MYDRYSLNILLQKTGFRDFRLCLADQSSLPNFSQYCLDILENGGIRKPDSLFIEAYKGQVEELSEFEKNRELLNASISENGKDNADDTSIHQKNVKLLIAAIRKVNTQKKELTDEIRKRDTLLNTQKKELTDEINKIGKQRAEYWQYYLDVVEEIHKRDAQLFELRAGKEKTVEIIKEREDQLTAFRQESAQTYETIKQKDDEIAKIKNVNRQSFRDLPLVSIVTPVLNCARWIETCILSVLHQDYLKIEHIIVDGGSTDGTLEICKKYPHLMIHSKQDRGQSHAINKGFAMAQGEILAWLCADDLYEPGAVTAAVKTVFSGNDVVMGYSRFIDADGNVMSEHPANAHSWYDHGMFLQFWKYNPISQSAVFWNRKIWKMCGPVKESLFFAMDYDLWLRMSRETYFARVEAYIAQYRVHSEAKCFADNYGSRIELINVSKKYWPSRWRLGFWKLYFSYYFTNNAITQHYSDGTALLEKTLMHLDNSEKFKALFSFAKAHCKHLAAPKLPYYKVALSRIIKEAIRVGWIWNLGVKIKRFVRGRKSR
jgi:glycosyltransferase involved in cell wall biosynthesis